MRFFLYLIFILLLALCSYMEAIHVTAAAVFNDIFVVALVGVSLDAAWRIWKSDYKYFPLVMAVAMVIHYFFRPPYVYHTILEFFYVLSFAGVGILLLKNSRAAAEKGRLRTSNIMRFDGILCLILLIRLLPIAFPGYFLYIDSLFRSFLPGAILFVVFAASYGFESFRHRYRAEGNLFVYLSLLGLVALLNTLIV